MSDSNSVPCIKDVRVEQPQGVDHSIRTVEAPVDSGGSQDSEQIPCVVCQVSGHAGMFDIFRCFSLAQRIFKLIRTNFSLCRLRSSYICERCIDRLEAIEQLQELRREFVDSFLQGCSLDGPLAGAGSKGESSAVGQTSSSGVASPVIVAERSPGAESTVLQQVTSCQTPENPGCESGDGDSSKAPRVAKYLLSESKDGKVRQTPKDKRRNYSFLIKRLKGSSGEENGIVARTKLSRASSGEVAKTVTEATARLLPIILDDTRRSAPIVKTPVEIKVPLTERPRSILRNKRTDAAQYVTRSLSYRRILPKKTTVAGVVEVPRIPEPPPGKVQIPKASDSALKYRFEGLRMAAPGPEIVPRTLENVREANPTKPVLRNKQTSDPTKSSGPAYLELKEEVGGVSFFVLQSMPSQSEGGTTSLVPELKTRGKITDTNTASSDGVAAHCQATPKNVLSIVTPNAKKPLSVIQAVPVAPSIIASDVSEEQSTAKVTLDGSQTVESNVKSNALTGVTAAVSEASPACGEDYGGTELPKCKVENYDADSSNDDDDMFNLEKMEVNMLENVVESFLKLEQEHLLPSPKLSPVSPSVERTFGSKATTPTPAAPSPLQNAIPAQVSTTLASMPMGFQSGFVTGGPSVQQIMFANPEPLVMVGGVPIITPYVAPQMSPLVGLPLANGCIQTTTSQFQSVLQPVQFVAMDNK